MFENLQPHHIRRVEALPHHPAKRQEGFFRRLLLSTNGVGKILTFDRSKRHLPVNARRYRNAFKLTEVLRIQIRQLLLNIHITIKVNIAIRRMIILAVEAREHLLGQLGNCLRITAGLKSIGSIWIKG